MPSNQGGDFLVKTAVVAMMASDNPAAYDSFYAGESTYCGKNVR